MGTGFLGTVQEGEGSDSTEAMAVVEGGETQI